MLIKGVHEADVFYINESVPEASSVERFISNKVYLEVAKKDRVPVTNKKNQVYDYSSAELGHLILKVSSISPQHRGPRRLEIGLSLYFRNNAKRAVQGAMALIKAGIPTPVALGCWTRRVSAFHRERWLLMRHAELETSLHHLLEDPSCSDETMNHVLRLVGSHVRHMHDVGWRHHDLAPGNVLVDGYLSDTPRVQFVDIEAAYPIGLSRLSRLLCHQLNLRSLFQLSRKLNPAQRMAFMEGYSDGDASRWQPSFDFWARHGDRSLRRFIFSFFEKR